MVSTAPAAVGRPPPPPKNPATSEVLPSSNRAAQRLHADARSLSREDEDGLTRPSSASYQRAAAVYASLPKTPGGTRTLVPDADGFIFRPSIEAEPKPMPRGRPRPVSRGLASLTASVARSPKVSLPTASASADTTVEDVPAPRIAWSEGIEDVPPDAASDDMLAAAAQIRRDWLARQLMDDNEESEAPQEDEQDSGRWHLRTEDGRRSLGELEESLAKAKQRAERGRRELAGYLETLRSKTFQADETDAMKDEELLVSLPVDFEDVVDINTSLTAERRKSRHRGPGASRDKGATPPGNTKGLSEDFKLPAFLEKYFFEEKAVEELPIVRLQVEEAAGESAVDKIARQIARLDTLLARREADGMARLKASKAEVEATKERLKRESEKSEAEKIELLQQLKERGFLRSNTSRATSAASSVQPSRGSSLAPSGAATPSSEALPEQVMIDWSVWESSAETDAPSAIQSIASCTSASPRERVRQDELDTSTFSLTSEMADLSTLSGRGTGSTGSTGSASRASHKLEPVLEDVADDGRLSAYVEGDPPDQDEEPAALAMLTEDPYNLEALQAIDDKLAKLVPESEWEAKSIRSLRTGSEISAAGQSKISKPSVRSSALSSSVLPGEPLLREQHEDRENRKALVAINDRISQLQDEGSRRPSEQLPPEQLQQLLLQAVAAQPAPDVDDKVLSLQAGSMAKLVHVKQTAGAPEVAGPLSKAREILARLEQSKGDLDDVAVEAKSSWKEVEDSVRVLEQSSSDPADVEAEDLEVRGPDATEMSTWAIRLEDLAREASNVAENGVPAARGTLPAVDVDAFVRGDWESADLLTIPTLSSARAGTDLQEGSPDAPMEWPVSEEGAFLSDGHGLDNPEELGMEGDEEMVLEWGGDDAGHITAGDDYSLSDDDAPVFLPVAEIVEPAKALDLELPAGPWSDEDLERYSRMMDEHLVDAKSTGAARPS